MKPLVFRVACETHLIFLPICECLLSRKVLHQFGLGLKVVIRASCEGCSSFNNILEVRLYHHSRDTCMTIYHNYCACVATYHTDVWCRYSYLGISTSTGTLATVKIFWFESYGISSLCSILAI